MRPVAVVIVDDDLEHPLEMTAVEDQQPVAAFGADGANEAFCDGVRLRRSHRRADDLDPFASEHDVEVARELAVAIVDEEANRCRSLAERPGELAGLLANPAAAWVCRAASEMHAAAAELDEEEHVQPLQPEGLDREEVDREHALRLRAQEVSPGEAGALTGRPQASSLEDRAHRGAETVRPRPRSSPTIR